MKLLSVNVGLPRDVSWHGTVITTGIFKGPVEGPVRLRTLDLDGDRQADLSVHGGAAKAAYLYPEEHYAFWHGELPDMELPRGVFGENFTTEGLLEQDIHIGDRFRIGGAEVIVTQPRIPCFKLAIRFGRADIVKRFLRSLKTGFYFGVLREGDVQAGDPIEPLGGDGHDISVDDIVRLYAFDQADPEVLRRVIEADNLPESWHGYFEHKFGHRG
jgi:MOSC domain-containing protein YiiM